MIIHVTIYLILDYHSYYDMIHAEIVSYQIIIHIIA
jgi:hypothetical protein